MTTYTEKLQLAEELRKGSGLDAGFPAENTYDKLAIRRMAAHLPEGFKVVLPKAEPVEDLSHMNPHRKNRK